MDRYLFLTVFILAAFFGLFLLWLFIVLTRKKTTLGGPPNKAPHQKDQTKPF